LGAWGKGKGLVAQASMSCANYYYAMMFAVIQTLNISIAHFVIISRLAIQYFMFRGMQLIGKPAI
jgi:hypothetical protein